MAEKKEYLGNYILSEKIGTGGMAEVFLAHHKKHPNKRFALKRMLTKFSQNKSLVNMFIQEASLASILNHPNIIPIYDFGVIDNQYFLAMEYLEGKDLKSVLRACIIQKKSLPVALCVHIACQALHALHYAHNKCDHYQRPLQIVHRDISPQNIMISFDGNVKILDFGIAKAIAKPGDEEKGMLKGKFSYMSPEQASGKAIDPRSDVFAVGIVLWELLTLHSCYTANDPMELIKKVRLAKIAPPHIINQKVPLELSDIIMKALERNLQTRYQGALEFGIDLENFLLDRYGSVNHADMISFLSTVFYEPKLTETLNEALQNNTDYVSFNQFNDNKNGQFDHSKYAQSSKLKKVTPWKVAPSLLEKYLKPLVVLALYILTGLFIYQKKPALKAAFTSPPAYIQSTSKAISAFLTEKNIKSSSILSLSSSLPSNTNNAPTVFFNKPIADTINTLRAQTILALSQQLEAVAQKPENYFKKSDVYEFTSSGYTVGMLFSKETQSLNIISLKKNDP
ncbi:MAG TPA: serine/threonine-protein kinase [Oligoflexia bacterium]|nr:serine/threonine-protein kinase [Oligoflexia bacterium]HMR24882.1 serine/threonine-protein kinase [Oligoflexia bacterium]